MFILIGISKSYDLSIYKHKNKILNMQYDLQISNLKRLESKEEYIRKISHDINNHKIALHTLIENNEKEKALNYLKNLGVDSYKTNELYTKNNILNAILLSKKEICTLNNIDLSLDIKIPSSLKVSDFDLCIIFGNLLDNSIEATKKLKKSPYIRVKAKIINSNLVLEVKNNYNGELVIKNNNIFTTKKDKLNHGFGISNIKSTVSKLNGIYEINKDSKEFSSIIMIPLEN
ncbi:ATP-binding protein [Clostridium sp. LY3-2]|uniref:sensor histidine kinase n=1 Tax=Clostridium sp. LY3-2 TaxID=2942482 RepID=UPI0021524FFF|nr:ATP-binding protein [Clostridium sp. LY3-2]MCR6514485.1 ATP-binding protein [Clostridium sp. LY3-2]